MNELCKLTATEAISKLRHREIKPIELVEASINRIEEVDGTVNALPIHIFEIARKRASNMSSLPIVDKSNEISGVASDSTDISFVTYQYIILIYSI